MNSKKTTYFLFVMVAIVWGAITVRIIKHFKSPEVNVESYLPSFAQADTLSEQTDYTLSLKYNDPFLKGIYRETKPVSSLQNSTRRNTSIRQRITPKTKSTDAATIVWPELRFSGVITNDKSNERLALLSIKGETYLMRVGESKQEISLEALYTDSVKVSMSGEMKMIEKTN